MLTELWATQNIMRLKPQLYDISVDGLSAGMFLRVWDNIECRVLAELLPHTPHARFEVTSISAVDMENIELQIRDTTLNVHKILPHLEIVIVALGE